MTKHIKPTNYETLRNALIPQAEALADSKAGPEPDGKSPEYQVWARTWNTTFHDEMNRLWRVEALTTKLATTKLRVRNEG